MYECLPLKKTCMLKKELAVVMNILMSKSYLLEFMQNLAECLCYVYHRGF